ncbi:hypothetical protein FZEAL_6410 [Fusarium zealandicum]|uniref:Uncharacterized protein n=1 Tax=Fusarium zealandicum TaxID=1053134 RepID=A0A8H4XIU8_9HYPO|nr:hypothetical protein FZEAL_6410 [Fusarium zealandicum]
MAARPKDPGLGQKSLDDIVLQDMIKEEIKDIIVQDLIDDESEDSGRLEIAALAALLLARRNEDSGSSDYYDSSYEYYDEDEEEEDGFWDGSVSQMKKSELEPEPISRKRGVPPDETPCPAPKDEPQAQPRKRQRVDSPAEAENSSLVEHRPAPGKTIKIRVPSSENWQQSYNFQHNNSHLHPVLQESLHTARISLLHPAAQRFLLRMNCDAVGATDLAEAVVDMGIRFSKVANDEEYDIVFDDIDIEHSRSVTYTPAVAYTARVEALRHLFFWKRVQIVTGRPIPPDPHGPMREERRREREKKEQERRAKENGKIPGPLLSQAGVPANRKPVGMLKASSIKEIDEKTKLPLDERVRKWLSDVVSSESKG